MTRDMFLELLQLKYFIDLSPIIFREAPFGASVLEYEWIRLN